MPWSCWSCECMEHSIWFGNVRDEYDRGALLQNIIAHTIWTTGTTEKANEIMKKKTKNKIKELSNNNQHTKKEYSLRLISREMQDYRAAQQICANRRSVQFFVFFFPLFFCCCVFARDLRRKWYYDMKIMQLIGTKNCKVFVNHVELIASSLVQAHTVCSAAFGRNRRTTTSTWAGNTQQKNNNK